MRNNKQTMKGSQMKIQNLDITLFDTKTGLGYDSFTFEELEEEYRSDLAKNFPNEVFTDEDIKREVVEMMIERVKENFDYILRTEEVA